MKWGKGVLQGFIVSLSLFFLFCQVQSAFVLTGCSFSWRSSRFLQSSNLRRGSEEVACVFGLEIIVILHISALNLCGAQTLVIAVTSWPMLFEDIIMVSDNEGKKAWLHPTEYFFFPLQSSPLCESSYWRLHHTIISVSVSYTAMPSSNFKSLIEKWIIIGWKMFWVSACTQDCGNFQLLWGNQVCVCIKAKQWAVTEGL